MQRIYANIANQTTCPLWSMQFHVMFSLGNCESASKHIQPGEGPNRGLLRNLYNHGCGTDGSICGTIHGAANILLGSIINPPGISII